MSDTQSPATRELMAPELSVAREKIIEQRLVSDLAVLMLRRGAALDVLRSEFDAQGHDVVLEAAGFIRHVQFKATVAGGKRRNVDINVKLRAKPSGCVVWMTYDPATLVITGYRWLGAAAGERLPDIGSRVTRHSKGDSTGTKGVRPGLRVVPKTSFEPLSDLAEVADRLFGPARSASISLVLKQLREQFGSEWRARVGPLVEARNFADSVDLAHCIDGYGILEQLCVLDPSGWAEEMASRSREDEFSNDAGSLWTQLFLEHRRWRQAPREPSGSELEWLDELARRTANAAAREFNL